MEPLAYRLRPQKLDDILGQQHLVGPKGVIRRLINNKQMHSLILYGPPGIGKTTIATVISNELGWPKYSFNASTDNKAQLKAIIDAIDDHQTILIVDEIHRMKKDIQDYLLPYVENGKITLIGLTTINPYMSVNAAIRSRCLIYRLDSLSNDDLKPIIIRALQTYSGEITIDEEAQKYIINMSNGEVRILINMIEILCASLNDETHITLDYATAIIQKPAISFDKNEDGYYDTLSGLQKSIRGSDVNAALHYVAKLLETEDLLPLIRRLYAIYYEDISIANPQLGPRVKAACEAALELGMPEARLPFASIVVDMALSPKSNSTYLAIDAALEDIRKGDCGNLPLHLKNTYSFDPRQTPYLYPHDYPGAWVDQQYLPDKIKDHVYYNPKTTSQYEKGLKERYDLINKMKTK